MKLNETRLAVNRIADKFGSSLQSAVIDIRPDYSNSGFSGYSYAGFSRNDRDVIYTAICLLREIVNNPNGSFFFDIENHYIFEHEALKDLRNDSTLINKNLADLLALKAKYADKETSEYPLQVCLGYYLEFNKLLDIVLQTDEIKEFEQPGLIEGLKSENAELRFRLYWSKRKWKYIIHLSLLPFFLYACCWVFIHRDSRDIPKYQFFLISAGALATIAFSLFFNNYSTFKDSWKIFNKTSWQALKQKEKAALIKKVG